MADRIKGITVEINGDTTKLQSALKGVNSSLKESQSALRDVNKLLKMDPGNTELLKQKQELLNKSIADTKSKLETEKQALAQLKNADQTEEVIRQQQALEREIISTEQSLQSLENEYRNFGSVASQQIANAGNKWKEAGSKISDVGKGMATAGAVITGAEVAIVAAGKGIFDYADSIADVGDAIDKNSQKLGVSAKFYQEWDAVLQHSGSSMESMGSTFKTLNKVTENATKTQQAALDTLGLKVEQFGGSSEKAFTMIVTALQKMPEGTERAYAAQQLLGKGATELGALFNTSADDTQAMIDKLNELGGVMSNEAVKNSAAFKDEMQDMQSSLAGMGNEIGAELMPSLIELMQEITIFVKDNKDDTVAFLKQLTIALSELIQQFHDMTPEQKESVLQMGAMIASIGPLLTIIGGLVTAIGGVVSGIGSIMTAAPAITGFFSTAATTVGEFCAALGPLGWALLALVGSVTWMISRIKECGMTWQDFVDGLGFMLADAKKFVVDFFDCVVYFFTDLGTKALNWGKDLVTNYLNGIKANINLLATAGKLIGEKIKSYIHFSEPDVGPLSDFHTYMPDMLKGLAEGINDNIGMLDKPMSNLASAMVPGTNGMNDRLDGIRGAIGNMSTNVNVTLEGDAQGLFKMVKTQNGKARRMTGRSALA